MLFVCAGPIGFCDGGDSRKGGTERGFHSGPGRVWGGKVARPPGEAVVAGALARAHALERHPGSSGGVPWPWSHCSRCGFCLLGFLLLASQWKWGRACRLWARSGSGGDQPTPLSPQAHPSSPGVCWDAPPCSQGLLGMSIPKRLSDSPLPPAQAAKGQVCTVASAPAPPDSTLPWGGPSLQTQG